MSDNLTTCCYKTVNHNISDKYYDCASETFTGWINRIAFPLSFLFILSSNNTPENIKLYENYILGIASISYLVLGLFDNSCNCRTYKDNIRYLDWLLTTPFLALIIYQYAVNINPDIQNDFQQWWFLVLPVIMVITGYIAKISPDYKIKILFLVLSFLALLILLYLIYELSLRVDLRGLQYFFYIGWTLYGLVFLIDDYCIKSTLYNILDFINKIVFSLYLTLVVFKS